MCTAVRGPTRAASSVTMISTLQLMRTELNDSAIMPPNSSSYDADGSQHGPPTWTEVGEFESNWGNVRENGKSVKMLCVVRVWCVTACNVMEHSKLQKQLFARLRYSRTSVDVSRLAHMIHRLQMMY